MTSARRLAVYLGARRVGRIDRTDDGLTFTYTEEWLADPDGFALSLSLPRIRDIDSRRARSFFANLLPEANVRVLVCRRLGISEGNDFALLEAIGGECAGALSILPEGVDPLASTDDYELLEPKRLRELAQNYEALPAVDGHGKVRLSLAGAQDKLPVLEEGGRYYLPRGTSPSTHILKFPNRNFKHLPANEVLLTELARRVGLPAVEARWEKIGGEGLCVVRRYDRVRVESGTIERLHQEDFCQALGVSSTSKYEQEGGPAFETCVDVVREHSIEPLTDTQALLRWLAFNAIAGNADGHAKNLSLLWEDGWRLAPFYDLVCTRSYERIDRRLAMNVGGENDPDKLKRRHLEACARKVDLKPTWLTSTVATMAESILDELAAAIDASGVKRSPVAERVVPVIRKQARRMLRELANPSLAK
jgi:serine/threonine-protein kinase HipA